MQLTLNMRSIEYTLYISRETLMCSPEESGQDDDMSENLRKAKEDINLEVTLRRGGWGGGDSVIKHLKGCQGAGPAPARCPTSVPVELALLRLTQVSLLSFRPHGGALNLYDGQLYVPT